VRLETAETSLCRNVPKAALFAEAAELGAQTLEPDADVHASAEYRRRVAAKLVRDLLGQAWERARNVT
jgi:carbon-monoxide dehydrogenase medium subunit